MIARPHDLPERGSPQRWADFGAARVRAIGCVAVLLLSGCVAVPVSVSNPVPGMTTVAVAPFFNLSSERVVDGRRFATAYFTELQKQPGFQVIPVGVVEQAIVEHQLSMDDPRDVNQLAELLGADAVVVGAVTDYKPYYPPQLGLQVQWYSPRPWVFYPGIPVNDMNLGMPQGGGACPAPVVRGQSGGDNDLRGETYESLTAAAPRPGLAPLVAPVSKGKDSKNAPPANWPRRRRGDPARGVNQGSMAAGSATRQAAASAAAGVGGEESDRGDEPDPRPAPQPLMSYTRFFDGADPQLVKSLRGYVAYRGDMRSGSWEAYLHRSDDFLQFTAHRMIVEMLAVHGGVLKTEYVFPYWK